MWEDTHGGGDAVYKQIPPPQPSRGSSPAHPGISDSQPPELPALGARPGALCPGRPSGVTPRPQINSGLIPRPQAPPTSCLEAGPHLTAQGQSTPAPAPASGPVPRCPGPLFPGTGPWVPLVHELASQVV